MENGARIRPPSGREPWNRYVHGYGGVSGRNTTSIYSEERANSNTRVPLKGSVFNEFPPFMAQPVKTNSKPALLVHLSELTQFTNFVN